MERLWRKSAANDFVRLLVILTAVALLPAGCGKDKSIEPAEETQTEKKVETEETTQKNEKPEPPVTKTEPKKPAIEDNTLKVKLETTKGDIVIELNEEKAPVTVENFLRYAKEGFFDGTIFHRVIADFMVQGGGFTEDMTKKPTHDAIVNEAGNGLKNDRGTIAMARTPNPNSASSQFFINLKNNDFLNYTGPQNPGYAVFGKVVEGLDVVDAIAAVKTTRKGVYSDVPAEAIVIKSASVAGGE